jgi:hypothetical protein
VGILDLTLFKHQNKGKSNRNGPLKKGCFWEITWNHSSPKPEMEDLQ